MTIESSITLKQLLDTTTDCLHELSNLGVQVDAWDIIVIYLIGSKLDVETRKQWELQVSQSCDELPSFKTFRDFLEKRFRALEFLEPQSSKSSSSTKALHVVSKISCPLCSEEHLLCRCKRFIQESVDQRRQIAKNHGLCFNCLRSSHLNINCRMNIKCKTCNRKHHTLLHKKLDPNTEADSSAPLTSANKEPPQNESKAEPHISTHFAKNVHSQVLLATAVVKARSRNGYSQVLRALLDQGSQASFITESAVQLLKLKKIAVKTTISGLGGGHSDLTSKYMVQVNIQSLIDSNFNFQIKAYVLSRVTSILPERKFTLVDWPELHSVELADPNFNKPSKIDILLGSEAYTKILKGGLIKDPRGKTMAQDTYLGWIVSGEVEDEGQSHHKLTISMHAKVETDQILKRFWELEAEPTNSESSILSLEEQACEDYFAATTRRDENGRYIVKLPFRSSKTPCNTKEIALKRLYSLERKLSKNSELKSQYTSVINDYLSQGHMEEITNEIEKNKIGAVYLPHHGVIRENKSTTKLRVVFDASAKGSDGVSLNDTLMVGPPLQADLRHTVMRWRLHPICLVADIIKMYRQVKVAGDHVDYQRILWREDVHSNVKEYRLLRVTFGISSAPYLAVKALQQTACDEGESYPYAASRIMTDFYMDDLMTGCQTEEEAVKIYHEFNELLNKTGFTLQKWTSNREELLKQIELDTGRNLEIKEDETTRILGLTWNRNSDEFHYTVNLPFSTPSSSAPETKRSVISEISRLYDPLGWIAPCIITAKIFIQKLWISGLDWDDELSAELLAEWQFYRCELQKLNEFRIPRWLERKNNDQTVELHGFSDASSVAYAAVVYMRVIDSEGQIKCNLVTAKTKVAPIKQVSIPRLELCGAVLVTKLLLEVARVLNVQKSDLHAWTDSTVVLAWLSDHPSRWKTFVANRTSEILTALDSTQWHYVDTKNNPADIASRGTTPTSLLNDSLWKHGPPWLLADTIAYCRPKAIMTKLEQRSVKVHAAEVTDKSIELIWSRFSSFRKLTRTLAYCRRFLNLKVAKALRTQLPPYLTASEISDTIHRCLMLCQIVWFETEIEAIRAGKNVSKNSGLISLNPYLDDRGLMRVGGRIQNSQLDDNMKHPIIVPYQSHLTKLLISDAHQRVLHGGPQLTLNFLRSKYWIVRGKQLIKAHIHNCVPCIRHAAVTRNQLMGQLPSCRVTPSKPFLHSGVDYAGPVQMRTAKGRGHKSYKGYICLFVCMATRAVHIEAVSDLTSEGFLSAFKRFVARRGHCSHLYSDNGTNFVGASKELKAMFHNECASLPREIAALLANNGTEWHFIPPHSPNFGGLWEAGIKSTKHHLRRVIGDSTLTFEELSTVLSQIEACLNSRPLSQNSANSTDPNPLTPGHFLVGQPLVIAPDYNYEHTTVSSLRRWQLTQRMIQAFWKRWSQEYLTMFFQRHKWAKRIRDPKVGDIVLVKEDNLPPAKWLYGRVIEVHPGKDNLVRVVTLQCKDSRVKRPTSKLCILPVNDE
ncbi:uncharacterized protein LOC123723018 [Papilio machaon]|uniref:uncharacterized protein LOC123723018 n=1 Tax=Papilio machaon TaxID=76193 RepID=UPI001E663991|nr:uncharacterized protein LOC123723018 [Papilio machaon]